MLPSWHNVSSGSSFQTAYLILPVPSLAKLREDWKRWRPKQNSHAGGSAPTHSKVCCGQVRRSPVRVGQENKLQSRMSLLMSGNSSETWKASEEDLNQKFHALRSPTVRSHCATNRMAQSHVRLTQGSAWSVEETPLNSIFLLLSCNTSPPVNSGTPEQYWSE